MALRLGRMSYQFEETAFAPHVYSGTFWDTATSSWVERTVTLGTAPATAAALQTEFENVWDPPDTFDWATPAPPVT